MLQNLLDMGAYLYTVVGIGVLGVLILTVMNSVSMRKVQNKKTYTKVVRRINTIKTCASIGVLAVTAAALGVTFTIGQAKTLGIQYVILGIGIVCLLIGYGKYLAFADRERVLGDYLFRLMDQQNGLVLEVVPEKEPEPPTREQLIERALQGIRESAAAGDHKFAHLLSQEEESVMREVINEFITQG